MCFYVTKREEIQKAAQTFGPGCSTLYLKHSKMVAISEISVQRTASSFSIKRIQDPVKNLNGPFCVIVSGRKL